MELLAPVGALALLAFPVILFLYFLKVRRPNIDVATLAFWRPYRTDRQANAPWQRLRASRLLVLQLAVALALGLALLRPALEGAAGVASSSVVILDGSASMQATDVKPSRFAAAVDHARQMVQSIPPGGQMAIILATQHSELLAASTSDQGELLAALDRAHPTSEAADLGEALSLANAVLAGRSGASITLISDGHGTTPVSPPHLFAPLQYVSVGVTAENLALEALTQDSNGSVFIRVDNYGRQPRDAHIELRTDGQLVDSIPIHVPAESPLQVTWSGLTNQTHVLEARLAPGDAFGLDDSAWLVTGTPPAHKALLVTAQNRFLERAMRLHPGLDVTVVAPADYKPGSYDLYVFDGFLPKGPLPTPALVVAPPQGQGPVPAGIPIDPGPLQPANPDDALLRDVSLANVHVKTASKVSLPQDWRAVISANAGPLVAVHEGEPRIAELTFDLHNSDFPLRLGFPVLIQNLLGYLLPGGFEGQVYPPGSPVRLATEPGARSLVVTRPDGGQVDLNPKGSAIFSQTEQPGVYLVQQKVPSGERQSRFVIQFQDPSLSSIAPGAAPAVQESLQPAGALVRGVNELWPWLAVLAILLLVGEWVVYHRGT